MPKVDTSPLHLPYISPASPLVISYISRQLASVSLAALDAFGLPNCLNLYLTAAGTRTSAPPHTDKQDVFVLQELTLNLPPALTLTLTLTLTPALTLPLTLTLTIP
jgi:hypothetical protein